MFLINLFLFNFIFNNFLIQRLFANNNELAVINLNNIQNDLSRISFPVNFTINYYFISFIISILSTLLLFFLIPKKIQLENPVLIIKEYFKILLGYSAVFFGAIYLLRIYSLSRGFILFGLIIYSFLLYLLVWFLRLEIYKNSKFKFVIPSVTLIFLLSFYFFSRQDIEEIVSVDSVTSTTTTTVVSVGVLDSDCKKWLGSNNFSGCISGIQLVASDYIAESLNNIVLNGDDIYLLDVKGVIYKNKKEEIFLDISAKVINRLTAEVSGEQGLFGLAFHPSENYILVTYSNLENNLTVEKFFLDENNSVKNDLSEIILKIPNSICCHWSGNIFWSNYFEDFVLSVGDMEDNRVPFFNSEPLDTTSPRGKVILLNKEVSNPDLLALDKDYLPKKNIIAYGLRNPWKTSEYKNYLFVPDVGTYLEEELNVLDLNVISSSKEPFLLGWPYFEASITNEIAFNEIYLHKDGEAKAINNYVLENSISPNVYYTHQAPENFRAALIGGDVLDDTSSKYHEQYFFADYLSGELFAYDFKKDKLFILPLGELGSFITSVSIHPNKKDTVLLSTGSGSLLELKLP